MMKFVGGILSGMALLGIAQAQPFDPVDLANAKCDIKIRVLERKLKDLGEVVLYLHQDLQRERSTGKRP